jgi:hypothetical protein
MAGLVPAIHVFNAESKTWMPGTSPGMTERDLVLLPERQHVQPEPSSHDPEQ